MVQSYYFSSNTQYFYKIILQETEKLVTFA